MKKTSAIPLIGRRMWFEIEIVFRIVFDFDLGVWFSRFFDLKKEEKEEMRRKKEVEGEKEEGGEKEKKT